jgi:hypothetical protein
MRAAFREIPAPLQRQTLIRLGLGAAFLVLLPALIIMAQDAHIWLPCAGAAMFFASSAFAVFRRAVLGEYVVVEGECAEVGQGAFKRREKHMLLLTGGKAVRVALRGGFGKIRPKASIRLYVSKNTPVYEKDGVQILHGYLAIEAGVRRNAPQR